MNMRSFACGLTILAVLAPISTADEIDVSGVWELTSESPRGSNTRDMTIAQDGTKLTVTMQSRRGEEVVYEGSVSGSEIEWSMTRETPRGEMTIVYKGTVNGDAMAGTVQFGNFGSGEWKAVKKKSE